MVKTNKKFISIIGLGYVGLPLLVEFSKYNSVIGIDNDSQKIKLLKKGISYISDVPNIKLKNVNNTIYTNDFSMVKNSSTIIICLPTPVLKNKNPNLNIVTKAIKKISRYLLEDQLIVLESTTYPRTLKDVIAPLINRTRYKVGKNIYLAFSPERINPGSREKIASIPKIIGADDTKSLNMAKKIYSKVFDRVICTNDSSYAEAAKLTENIFRSVNIALVNELKIIYDKMGIDIWEVIKLAKTKPFGYMPFYPGPGLGGHCIPIDPLYLSWQAKNFGLETKFINLTAKINSNMPKYIVDKSLKKFKHFYPSVLIKNLKVLIFGVAYKKDVNDLRESPALEIMKILRKKNINFDFYDKYIPRIDDMRHYPEFKGMSSVKLSNKSIKKYHLIILVTDHTDFDYKKLLNNFSLIIDTRNKFNKLSSKYIYKL